MPLKVTIIQRILPHYRVDLFKLIQKELEYSNIELNLIYGQELSGTVPRTVELNEPWAYRIKNTYYRIGGKNIVWQPCIRLIDDNSLIIVEQANSLLFNYLLILKRYFKKDLRIAYWGHGKNMQASNKQSISEYIKLFLVTKVDWWFAYTELTKNIVHKTGFPDSKITILQNAIDTKLFKNFLSKVSKSEIDYIKNELNLDDGPIGIYCGGMYPDKKLSFLIESCIIIRQKINSYNLILIGDGPDQHIAQKAANRYSWVHYIGPKFGSDRSVYFKIADVFLMPGLVGLAILDSLASGLPLFTTNLPIHSPEISYLCDGENGFITNFNKDDYANSVCNYLLSENAKKSTIIAACLAKSDEITLENMASHFAEGIKACICSEHV